MQSRRACLREVEQSGSAPFQHALCGQSILLVVELDVHQELLPGVPDVGVHAEGAVVLHHVEHDSLRRQSVVLPEVQHHYRLCLPLHSQGPGLWGTMHAQLGQYLGWAGGRGGRG